MLPAVCVSIPGWCVEEGDRSAVWLLVITTQFKRVERAGLVLVVAVFCLVQLHLENLSVVDVDFK